MKYLLSLTLSVFLAGCAGGVKKAPPGCPVSAPGDPSGEMTRAYELLRCGRVDEAVTAFSSVASAHPEDLRARMELGYARQASGNFSAAADDFELVSRSPGEFQEQARVALKSLREGATEMNAVQRDSLLDAGYEALRRGQNGVAREKFARALDSDPQRPDIKKQLGYMSLEEGDLAGAARSFEAARSIAPDECAGALELGYIYARLHNDAMAEKAFASTEWCPDAKVRAAGAAALKNVRAADSSLYLDLYASPSFTSRFQDKIAFFEATAGWKPKSRWPVSLYASARYMQDSRSRSGEIPEIYSDNAASFGPGIKLQPKNMNLALIAELDATRNLTRSAEHPDRTEINKRVVLSDYGYWERRRLFADAGASVGYYSRYRDNVIAYAQLRGGVVAWQGDGARVSLYAPFYLSKDGNRDFFNNYAEVGAGAELASSGELNLKLRAEYLRGFYMGISGLDPNPYSRAYNDVRVMLIWSMRFTKERRRAPVAASGAKAGPGSFRW